MGDKKMNIFFCPTTYGCKTKLFQVAQKKLLGKAAVEVYL